MAHFAQLDENNVVTQVIVVHNNELVSDKQSTVNDDGSVSVSVVESEANGIAFCQSLFGAETKWVQTSYNGSFRGCYAGVGYTFENGEFVAPPVVLSTEQVQVLTTEQIQVLATQDIQVLATEQVQVLSSAQIESLTTAQVQSLSTAQVQALTTAQISQLGA